MHEYWLSHNTRARIQAVDEQMAEIRLAQSAIAGRTRFTLKLPSWNWSLRRANKGEKYVNTGGTVLAIDQKCADGPTPA